MWPGMLNYKETGEYLTDDISSFHRAIHSTRFWTRMRL
jgi:hypothetical protein